MSVRFKKGEQHDRKNYHHRNFGCRKAAKEILEHIQAIKDIQRRMVWFGSDIQIVLDSKEEAASGN